MVCRSEPFPQESPCGRRGMLWVWILHVCFSCDAVGLVHFFLIAVSLALILTVCPSCLASSVISKAL